MMLFRQLRSILILTACVTLFSQILTSQVSWAQPPEGFGPIVYQEQRMGEAKGEVKYGLLRQDPAWSRSIEQAEWSFSTPLNSWLILGSGTQFPIAQNGLNRDAYYLRFDFKSGSQTTFAIKWIHQNWYYIMSAKETIAMDYNSSFTLGGGFALYGTFGIFYRWLKQRWHPAPLDALRFDTNDQEGYFQGIFGIKYLHATTFWTLDINNRDRFSFYNGDNLGVDFTLNIPWGSTTLFQWLLGARFSSWLAGTAYPSESYSALTLTHFL